MERIVLPPQQKVEAYLPIDLRITRWELYQELRHVPIMSGGRLVHTLILPWHISMDAARLRIEESAPPNHNWLLTANSPDNWMVHQLPLPERVRAKLQELERIKQFERGGMKAAPKHLLHVHMKHSGEIQDWKVELDMTVGYLVKVIALEEDTHEKDVLIMRGAHVPGAEECIVSYLPTVQVYLIDKMVQYVDMSRDHLRAGVLWQWSKKGGIPWPREYLPVPKGPPLVLSPHQLPEAPQVLHVYLRPAHCLHELYVVHMHSDAVVGDVLRNLEPITGYVASSMLLVKEGVVLSTKEHAAVCNPMSFILVGDQLQAVDVCAAQAADWCDLWSLSCSTETTSRGGARTARTAQQPRAVMLLWAEDKKRREIDGLNVLTVRMLLRAEQRTVAAVLHSRSAAQTREVMVAAYRRAGLVMDTT